jgi:hypothetical protein
MFSIISTSPSVQSTSAFQKFVEKIDVRGKAIHVTFPPPIGSVTGYHLFIVYTEKHGKQFVCQGFPFDPATGKIVSDEILPSDPPGLLTKGQCIQFLPQLITKQIENDVHFCGVVFPRFTMNGWYFLIHVIRLKHSNTNYIICTGFLTMKNGL